MQENVELYSPKVTSSKTEKGFISGRTFGEKSIEYANVDGTFVFEGDIVLAPSQLVEQSAQLTQRPSSDAVVSEKDDLWTNKKVFFVLDDNLSETLKKRIKAAIKHWEANTVLTFEELEKEKGDFIRFKQDKGCWSYVGRIGGEQEIGLESGCGLGAVIHEIGHAVGLWHTQSREDRNNHIKVLLDNVQDGPPPKGEEDNRHNFKQHINDGDDVGPYPHDSIMHYGPTGFRKADKTGDTIESAIPIGQRFGLSTANISIVAKLYGYPENKGVGEFYKTTGHGSLADGINHSGWCRTWSQIIPGNFSNGSSSGLLFYDWARGVGVFYSVSGDGNIKHLKTHKDWRKTWAHIIPGNFGGSGYTDLLFYDPIKGEGEFYTTDGKGNISLLGSTRKGWRKTWAHIIPGNFGGSGYTDLLFYDPIKGEGEFYATNGKGNISLLGSTRRSWRKTWAHIIPGNFGGNGYTDLLFYDWRAREGEFYISDGKGDIDLLSRYTTKHSSWIKIVPGNFSDNSCTDLLFYDPGKGEGEFLSADGRGGVRQLNKLSGWRKSWEKIIPLQYGGNGYTDLLFYQASDLAE